MPRPTVLLAKILQQLVIVPMTTNELHEVLEKKIGNVTGSISSAIVAGYIRRLNSKPVTYEITALGKQRLQELLWK